MVLFLLILSHFINLDSNKYASKRFNSYFIWKKEKVYYQIYHKNEKFLPQAFKKKKKAKTRYFIGIFVENYRWKSFD